MARLAKRRTRTPDSDDEEESRPQTPISTAPDDRKRARRNVEDSDESQSEDGQGTTPPAPRNSQDKKPVVFFGQVSSGHKPGAIVRVKLTNFVTYTSAEFRLGPSLNMIIGPNGTGKSTLVCAICLGLGWATSYLGRAKDAAEFVKHGCREATIEIELQRKDKGQGATNRNPVITRTIKRDGGKSKWTLNGRENMQKGIQALCKDTYNIQIDNLCQFLPQDKVVEFAQMNPVQILESTQSAAGTKDMAQFHENLKQLRAAQKALLQENRGSREQLENLERRQEMQRTEVERMQERAETKKKLGWLEQCLAVPKYLAAKNDVRDAKKRQEDLNAEVIRLRREIGPVLRRVNAKQQYAATMLNLSNDMKREVRTAIDTADAKLKEIEDLDVRARDLQANEAGERKATKTRSDERLKLQQKLTQLTNQYQQKPSEFDARAMSQEIKDRRDEIRHLNGTMDEVENKRRGLAQQGKSRQENLGKLNDRLSSLNTQAGQQANKLEALSKDTSDAWEWIRKNQHLFEKPIFGPPIVECSLKDLKLARQIESMMQSGDFKIITAQTDKDFALLQRKLNGELGLSDISLRTCSDADLTRFRRAIPDDELAAHGLDSYIIDHLTGPPIVLAMLCLERALHQSAFVSGKLTDKQHNDLQDSELKNYISGDTIFQFMRRAEYGKEGTSTRTKGLKDPKDVVWAEQRVDVGRSAAIQREIKELSDDLETISKEHGECKKEITTIKTKQASLTKEIDEIQADKDQKQQQQMQWNGLPVKIKDHETKIAGIDEWLTGARGRVDEWKAKAVKCDTSKAGAVIQYADCLTDIKEAKENSLEAEILHIQAQSDAETLVLQNTAMKDAMLRAQDDEKEAREIVKNATKEAKQLIGEVRAIHQAANDLKEEHGDKGFVDLLRKMSGVQDEQERPDTNEETGVPVEREGPWSAQRLDAEIDSQKAALEMTDGGSMRVIKEFEDRAKAIEKLQARLTTFNEKQKDYSDAMREVRAKWEPGLDALVAKISVAFADSFARIGCAGQIAVYKAPSDDPADCTEENGGTDNGLDFGNWSIHVSVKFRDSEPLSLLDSHRQSGGERAVSTIFYLMALQSLSRAPFRVVDEINQGMDPRNERMVHGRMVDIATDDGGSQYFLITPKLLGGLKYKRGMTISCIVSGENVPGDNAAFTGHDDKQITAPAFDFSAFAKTARRLNMAGGDGGRRVDSGVGMASSFGSVEVGA